MLQNFKISNPANKDAHKYLNVYVANNTGIPSNLSVQQQFNDTFIQNPSEYKCSVVKFSISTTSIPILLSTTALSTSRSVIVCYQDISDVLHSAERFLTFPDTGYDGVSQYDYNQFEFTTILEAVNSAYAQCFADLATAGIPQYPPVFALDPVTGKLQCTLNTAIITMLNNASNPVFPARVTGESIYIGVNKGCRSWFDYFYTYDINGTVPSPFPANLSQLILFKGVLPAGTQTLTQYQSSLDNIREVTNIVILSSGLPIATEYLPLYTVQNNNQIINTGASADASLNILSEYSLLGNENLNTSVLIYTPTAQYRYTDLIGTTPLSTVRLDIYYLASGDPANVQPKLYPLKLNPNAIFDIKILFERR